MSALPTPAEIQSAPSGPISALAITLEVLFEHSPILINLLEPQLAAVLKSSPPIASYTELINLALEEIEKWEVEEQSEFISGHPRIGESKNLSTLSASEQGAQGLKPTPPEVLARLEHLNACYERRYPGLRYITFVNGRSRAAIVEEMEDMLKFSHSLSDREPTLESVTSVDVASEEWKKELSRAVYDVGRIGKSRLGALGVH
ncbi:hypothetical protein CVT25_013740 [Psilocybe cyanescens]|uniref:Oxo-4-hydroxy-4-carboxy-5-ureidoimidazoline decarboxylase domain-containing protein n=1 Tax=Psilocybe cyanescens TaxID=93625 RepID=A0A409XL38_PSICY|nr:hypothetical protein CVT25_013740 [Psilocybe cyanescens]